MPYSLGGQGGGATICPTPLLFLHGQVLLSSVPYSHCIHLELAGRIVVFEKSNVLFEIV